MKIIADMSGDYADGVPAHLKLEQFSEESDEEVLFYGYNSVENLELQEKYSSYKRKVLLNLWTPCDYMNEGDKFKRNALKQPEFFDEIYTICPYTIDWLKDSHGDERYKYIFHPFDGSYAPADFEKDSDVCYFGGVHGKNHWDMVEVMTEFNHRLISMNNNPFVTHHNVPHHTKLDLVAKTKISLCSNILPLEDVHLKEITKYPEWDENEAFNNVMKYAAPQYKCRAAEAAFCKSLLMVKRDEWNLIEHYFVPDEEFIYYENKKDLKEKISHVLKNYDDYSEMIEKAYLRSFDYTSKPLVDIIKNKKEWSYLNV